MGSCILVVFYFVLVPDFLPSVAFPNMQYRSGAHDANDAEPAHPLQCGLRSQATKSFVLSSFPSSSSACFVLLVFAILFNLSRSCFRVSGFTILYGIAAFLQPSLLDTPPGRSIRA